MRLTLLHKGLLLVSIPLCFEITIFGILINLQNQAELEAQRVNQNKKINDAVNHIMIYGIRLVKFSKASELTAFFTPEFKKDLHELRQNFARLEELTRNEPELFQKVEAAKQSILSVSIHFDYLKSSLQSAKSDALRQAAIANRRNLDRDIVEVRSSGLLELADRSLRGTDDARSRVLRERATMLLKYAVGLSVLTGIFGVTMFSKHLASRLHKLGNNASRLARGEPLEPPQEGSDEIAALDKSFHYAAGLIAQAARIRQEVTAMITHDLKTPLQSIRNFFALLRQGELGELNEQGVTLLEVSEKESKRMVGLIDSVLQLEQLRSGNLKLKLTAIDLPELLNKSIDAVQILADDKQIEIKREFRQAPNETIEGDPFWLEQVLANILSNAIKFSPPKTSVTVSLQSETTTACIKITDQGPGIAPEEQSLVFERFQRASSTSKNVAGSGLGLTIAKELVELHGGSISIESQLGSGTAFILHLPRTISGHGKTAATAWQGGRT